MIKTISDWLCSLVINGYIVPIMIILALIIVLLIAVLLEDDIKKKSKNNKIEIELEEERIDVKELILRNIVREIAKKYCEGEETIKGLIKRYKKTVRETNEDARKNCQVSEYELFVGYMQFKLDIIGTLFMVGKLEENKKDVMELIKLLKEEAEGFEKELSRIIEE